MNQHEKEIFERQWQKNNVLEGEEGICCECGEKVDFNQAYTSSIKIGEMNHWYTGHKGCVMITTERVRKESSNKDHVALLKKDRDDFIEDKMRYIQATIKKNRRGTGSFTFDYEQGIFKDD